MRTAAAASDDLNGGFSRSGVFHSAAVTESGQRVVS